MSWVTEDLHRYTESSFNVDVYSIMLHLAKEHL